MALSQFAADFANWAIVATADGYEAQEVPLERIGAPDVIAIHPSRASADNGLKRVRIIASLPTPSWEGSICYAEELRETINRVIHEVALPGPEADDPKGEVVTN